VGWSTDSKADATLVVNALDMAIDNRRPKLGGIVHGDHGTYFTSGVFGLANAIFDYLEIFHNRQRRHSALGYRTPTEYELSSTNNTLTAVSQPPELAPIR
jgi:transposase InsO family protein